MQAFDSELINIFSNYRKAEMLTHFKLRPEMFDSMVQMALSDNQPHSWRAAWLLWSVMLPDDERLKAYLPEITEILPHRRQNQQRELLIILQKLTIPEELHASLFDTCINLWQNISHPPSLRYNALKLLVKMAKKHPELTSEIHLYTQSQHLDTLTKGAKDAVRKLLKTTE